MTGILVCGNKQGEGSGQTPFTMLEPAFSADTKDIAHRVQALQSQLSPGSLGREVVATSDSPLQERLFDALANVKILTSQIAMHLNQQWRSRLFEQLDSLHDPDEWEENDQPIQQASFATFLKPILSIAPQRRPGLGLSSAGHLIAAWTDDQGNRLTIEFLPARIRWVLSRRYGDEVERFAADTTVDRFAVSLATYNPQNWFEHAAQNHQSA
jgi:hypothetical protein